MIEGTRGRLTSTIENEMRTSPETSPPRWSSVTQMRCRSSCGSSFTSSKSAFFSGPPNICHEANKAERAQTGSGARDGTAHHIKRDAWHLQGGKSKGKCSKGDG